MTTHAGEQAWQLLRAGLVAEGDEAADWKIRQLRKQLESAGRTLTVVVEQDVTHLSAEPDLSESTFDGGYGQALVRLRARLSRIGRIAY